MKPGASTTRVQQIFSDIAPTYDLVNDAMTFGLARLWRKTLVKKVITPASQKALDCATGTGDVAIEFKNVFGDQLTVTACDFSREMLAFAPAKAKAKGHDIDFQWADLTQLPFADNSFDACTISYGLRNVSDRAKGVHEMLRVTKPHGKVGILETGKVSNPILRWAMELYFKYVVPRVGGWLSGKPAAYNYLNETSMDFPGGKEMQSWLQAQVGNSKVELNTFMGGASFLYVITKAGQS